MHILHIIISLDVGGAELMLSRLILEQKKASNNIHTVISLRGNGLIADRLKENGVRVISLRMTSMLKVPLIIFKLMMILREIKPNVVQTWMYHADLIGGISAKLAGISNVIWGVRTTEVALDGKPGIKLIQKVNAFLSKFIPKYIVCAANASLASHTAIGYDSTKMLVIPNGFDIEKFQFNLEKRTQIRSHFKIDDSNLVIGSVGRFHTDKDQKNFIEAALSLCESYPNLRFMMVGRNVDFTNPEIFDWIGSSTYKDRFILCGQRSDVVDCMSAMDVFCLHSKTEGFPNVLGEAMTLGLPCISTNVGDAKVLLGDTGFLVESANTSELALAMKNMVDLQTDERFKLGSKAKSRILENFTMAKCNDQFQNLYEKILN